MSYVKFNQQIDQALKEFGKIGSDIATKAAKEGWKTAVKATPPGKGTKRNTGSLRFNWKLTSGRRSSYVPKRMLRSEPRVPKFRFSIRKDSRILLYNNMPYASYVNNGEGNGLRTPRKMIQKARVKIASELERGVRKHRNDRL